MKRLRAWMLRLGGLFDKPRRDRDLDEEIESHVQLHMDDGLREGLTPAEARRQGMAVRVALPASWLPARRVAKVDPMEALRSE